MQILTSHITWRTSPTSEYLASNVSINVPGLGIVEIQDFISNELRNKIEAEAIFALNQKLKNTI